MHRPRFGIKSAVVGIVKRILGNKMQLKTRMSHKVVHATSRNKSFLRLRTIKRRSRCLNLISHFRISYKISNLFFIIESVHYLHVIDYIKLYKKIIEHTHTHSFIDSQRLLKLDIYHSIIY